MIAMNWRWEENIKYIYIIVNPLIQTGNVFQTSDISTWQNLRRSGELDDQDLGLFSHYKVSFLCVNHDPIVVFYLVK